MFDEGIDLPDFAAFPCSNSEEGQPRLVRYYDAYLAIADRDGVGISLDTPTWRASTDWAAARVLERAHGRAARGRGRAPPRPPAQWERPGVPVVISGVIGPRGDGYQPGELMSPEEAEGTTGSRRRCSPASAADLVVAVTMNYEAEAIGIARAAEAAGMPVAISFTVETDGALPTGQSLWVRRSARSTRRRAATPPTTWSTARTRRTSPTCSTRSPWSARIGGIRANSSRMSHAELDEAEELDPGDPAELGALYRDLRTSHPSIRLVGGAAARPTSTSGSSAPLPCDRRPPGP